MKLIFILCNSNDLYQNMDVNCGLKSTIMPSSKSKHGKNNLVNFYWKLKEWTIFVNQIITIKMEFLELDGERLMMISIKIKEY